MSILDQIGNSNIKPSQGGEYIAPHPVASETIGGSNTYVVRLEAMLFGTNYNGVENFKLEMYILSSDNPDASQRPGQTVGFVVNFAKYASEKLGMVKGWLRDISGLPIEQITPPVTKWLTNEADVLPDGIKLDLWNGDTRNNPPSFAANQELYNSINTGEVPSCQPSRGIVMLVKVSRKEGKKFTKLRLQKVYKANETPPSLNPIGGVPQAAPPAATRTAPAPAPAVPQAPPGMAPAPAAPQAPPGMAPAPAAPQAPPGLGSLPTPPLVGAPPVAPPAPAPAPAPPAPPPAPAPPVDTRQLLPVGHDAPYYRPVDGWRFDPQDIALGAPA